MTTREEIREGIAKIVVAHPSQPITAAREILQYLHSQGVVLKVDREPREPGYMEAPGWKKVGWHSACNAMIRDGFVAVVPLIEK